MLFPIRCRRRPSDNKAAAASRAGYLDRAKELHEAALAEDRAALAERQVKEERDEIERLYWSMVGAKRLAGNGSPQDRTAEAKWEARVRQATTGREPQGPAKEPQRAAKDYPEWEPQEGTKGWSLWFWLGLVGFVGFWWWLTVEVFG